jgi:hypothetical protein
MGADLPPDLVPPGWPGPVVDPAELVPDAAGSAPAAGQAGDLAEILHTSGTTAAAKGVAYTHENILAHDLPPEPETERAAGGRSFVMPSPSAPTPVRRCCACPCVGATGPPSAAGVRPGPVVRPCRRAPGPLPPAGAGHGAAPARLERDRGPRLSPLERVTLSSAPAPPALLARLAAALPQASLWNADAVTEAGAARTLAAYDPSRPTCLGHPVGGTEVKVLDEDGQPVVPGQVGEIWLRRRESPPRWYYGDPVATAATFVKGWVRTGDLGSLDDAGALYLVDRRRDVIITGGANVSSLEVEQVLAEHPAVAEAAVVAWPHPVLGESVAAAVVVRQPTSASELQAFVRQRLGEHKTPQRVVFVDDLPRNASGKVLKRELRDRLRPRRRQPNTARQGTPSSRPSAPSGRRCSASIRWASTTTSSTAGPLPGVGPDRRPPGRRLRGLLPVAALFEASTVVDLTHGEVGPAGVVEDQEDPRPPGGPPLRQRRCHGVGPAVPLTVGETGAAVDDHGNGLRVGRRSGAQEVGHRFRSRQSTRCQW